MTQPKLSIEESGKNREKKHPDGIHIIYKINSKPIYYIVGSDFTQFGKMPCNTILFSNSFVNYGLLTFFDGLWLFVSYIRENEKIPRF